MTETIKPDRNRAAATSLSARCCSWPTRRPLETLAPFLPVSGRHATLTPAVARGLHLRALSMNPPMNDLNSAMFLLDRSIS